MASNTEICNIALSHVGVGKSIANLDTEQSQEAVVCRVFFETVRDAVLRDFAWPFASRTVAVGLIEEDPNDEWDYSYRYPTDCLSIRRVLSGVRNDTHQSRVPYKIAQDDDGRLIYCDTEDAEIEYTVRAEDPELYSPDFVMALSFRLAFYIAPRLTGGDPFGLGSRALKMYEYEISKAKASAANEEQYDNLPESEFIRTRE